MVKKILSFLVAMSLLTGVTVSAEDSEITYDSTVNDSPTQIADCTVEVEKAELYCVKLPKSVRLGGEDDSPSFTYTVEVSGEISSDNYVRVIPLDGGYIETDNGTRVDVTVEQEVKKWASAEVKAGATTTGVMTATDLNPGKYSGRVQFFISLDDGYFYQNATCTTPKLRIAQDTNENGVQDTGEELATPEAVGKALGHAYEGEHEFEYNCTRCRQTIYEVSTPQELYDFSAAVAAGNTFSGLEVDLINDIDMYDLTSVTAFTPIGTNNTGFAGVFNGNNHSISGMAKHTVLHSNDNNRYIYTGLFGNVRNATIKNLVYTDSNVFVDTLTAGKMGYSCTYGAFVGRAENSVVLENCRLCNITTTINFARNANATNGMGNGYSYSSPFIGYVTGTNVNTIIKNCCATNNKFIIDAATYTAGALNCYMFLFGWYAEAATLTVDSSYVSDTLLSYISTNATSGVKATEYYDGSVTAVYTNLPYAVTGTNCTALTDDELKSQTGVDLLNTGYDPARWKLDLLNENNGYPIQIMS